MKLGITISLLVVVFFVVIGVVSFRGVAEPPTAETRPEKLVRQILPASLPKLNAPKQPAEDASGLYRQAFNYFNEHRVELSTTPPHPDRSSEVTDLIIAAANKGQVAEGFLDKRTPIDSGLKPSDDEAVMAVATAALVHAEDSAQFNKPKRAREAAYAVWAMGHRAFEHNVRLDYRWQGLTIMIDAMVTLSNLAEHDESIDADPVWEWLSALQAVDSAWQKKHELIAQVRPHVGDLINVARHDKDMTFRVEALLKLGVIKFAPGSRGNHRAIMATIEDALATDDPHLQAAGSAAINLSKEDLSKIY